MYNIDNCEKCYRIWKDTKRIKDSRDIVKRVCGILQLRPHENKSVDIAFINSIHLEDRDLFDIDACSKFALESGIMNRENIIYLEQLRDNYVVRVPSFNEKEV